MDISPDEPSTIDAKDRACTAFNNEVVCAACEDAYNGEPINWTYWAARTDITPLHGARLTYFIDPHRWPGNEYEQGPIPNRLLQKIEKLASWLAERLETCSLHELVVLLGDDAPKRMRDAVAPILIEERAVMSRLADQQHQMQEAGRYTLETAADALSTKTGWEAGRWLGAIQAAVKSGELPLRNPRDFSDPLPYPTPRILREFYDQVDRMDVNKWLESHAEWTDERLEAQRHAVTSAKIRKIGLTKREILCAEWPGRSNLRALLSDVPKWLTPALVDLGRAGRRSHTWDPAMIAVCLFSRNKVPKKALSRHIATHFPDWALRWDELSEQL